MVRYCVPYAARHPGQVVYVLGDGRYLVSARIIDLETREDLTERILAGQRLSALAAIPEEHMAIAQQHGLRGTPFTITDTGRVIAGYMPASELIESLDSDKRSGRP